MSTAHTVFVYGTLRQGQPNRRVMEPHLVRELGMGAIRGRMYDLHWYPAIALDGEGTVVGEWVEVTDEGLKALDRLEGYPHLYDRAIVEDVSRAMRGWVYHISGDKLERTPVIECGDWVRHVEQCRA